MMPQLLFWILCAFIVLCPYRIAQAIRCADVSIVGSHLATNYGILKGVSADETPCGFTPFLYSPYFRWNGLDGVISVVVVACLKTRTGYHPEARFRGIFSDVAARVSTRWTYFRADLCLYSPESYTLDEKKEICNDMMATSKAIQDTMREDFQSYPPEFRSRLFDMLCQSSMKEPRWWWDVLVGDGDPLYRELEPLS